MTKKKDDKKELLIRFRLDEDGKVSFFDPCIDEIPAALFISIFAKICEVEKEWNNKIDKKKMVSYG